MDKRHLLLAEQYDMLGLYKVADNLENKIKTSQIIEETLDEKKKFDKLKQNVENYTGPASLLFLFTEINSLSKEATQHYLLKALEDLAKTKTITPSDISKLEKILLNVKSGKNLNISKPVLQMLEEATQGIKPSLAEVNALIPKNPKIIENTSNFLSKIKNLASKNPGEAALAEDVAQKIGTKIPAWQKLLKIVPLGLVLLNAYFLFPSAKEYFSLIKAGKINQIWNDPASRAQFLVFLADVISSVTIFFPPLAALSSALAAISIGYQGGMYAFDRYNELSGNQAKDLALEKFNTYDEIIKELGDIYQSDETNITLYINNLKINAEAKYALKLVVPDINKIIKDNISNKNEKFRLRVPDILNLPVLSQGRFKKNNQGKIVQVKTAPDFIKDMNNPENQIAIYDFNRALQVLIQKINIIYPLLFKKYKGKQN